MTIIHHPSDERILAHANGSLGIALSLVVSAHIDGCEMCRQTLALAEAMGGAFLDSATPSELSDDALSHVLGRLDMPAAKPIPMPAAQADFALPRSLRDQSVGMRRWLAPGIWARSILKDHDADTRVYLLGAAPGKALLRHRHDGIEMTQVLEGEFFDGETRYGPGDFLEADAGYEHRPVTGAGATCICLIASRGVPRGLPGLLMRVLT
jgi:putative transcriptional regulator